MALYYIARFIAGVFCLLYRVKVTGINNVPKEGAVVLCSNHLSGKDPIIQAVVMKRPVRFIAKKELFDTPVLGFFMRAWRMISVDRKKSDAGAYRTAIDALKNKEVLGIYVQGTRVKPDEASEAKSGAVLFALKGQAVIVPVWIGPRYKMFSRLCVNFGEPISLAEYQGKKLKSEEMAEIAEGILTRISGLAL